MSRGWRCGLSEPSSPNQLASGISAPRKTREPSCSLSARAIEDESDREISQRPSPSFALKAVLRYRLDGVLLLLVITPASVLIGMDKSADLGSAQSEATNPAK